MGCPGDDINNCDFTKVNRARKRINGTVEATPGYFAITMNTSVRAEMTTANRTSIYRFTFPFSNSSSGNVSIPLSPVILADLTDLPDTRSLGAISVSSTGRIQGNGTFVPSFGIGTYQVYFCADFKGAAVRDTGVFKNNRPANFTKTIQTVADGINSPPLPAGAYVQFLAPTNASNQILARVGISFVSNAQACANAESEIPDFNFDRVKAAANDAWKKKLSVISIDAGGASDEIQTVFWSGAYRSMISPQDLTGENPLWNSTEPCKLNECVAECSADLNNRL